MNRTSQPTYLQSLLFDVGGFYAGMLLFFAFAGAGCVYSGLTGWGTENGQASTGTLSFGITLVVLSVAGIAFILITTAQVAKMRRR